MIKAKRYTNKKRPVRRRGQSQLKVTVRSRVLRHREAHPLKRGSRVVHTLTRFFFAGPVTCLRPRKLFLATCRGGKTGPPQELVRRTSRAIQTRRNERSSKPKQTTGRENTSRRLSTEQADDREKSTSRRFSTKQADDLHRKEKRDTK